MKGEMGNSWRCSALPAAAAAGAEEPRGPRAGEARVSGGGRQYPSPGEERVAEPPRSPRPSGRKGPLQIRDF